MVLLFGKRNQVEAVIPMEVQPMKTDKRPAFDRNVIRPLTSVGLTSKSIDYLKERGCQVRRG